MSEKIQVQRFHAVDEQIAQYKKQNTNYKQGANTGKRQHDGADDATDRRNPHRHGVAAFCDVARMRSLASALITIVRPKSTNPAKIRAETYKSPLASANSLAITAAIE